MPDRAGDIVRGIREDLDRSVFLPSPPETLRFRGWEGVVVLVSFLALATVLQLFRVGPSSALDSLWAEDGPVFLGEALTHDFFDAGTATQAGYLVAISRLIGELGAIVPLHDAAAAMNLTAVLVVALSGLAVWFASAGHVRSPYLRALLVALTVLCPVSGMETIASPTNVAWQTTFAVFWLLLWRPATTWGACLSGLLILATGLSTPATLFFTPIAVMRAVAIRDRRDALIVGAFALAMAIQLPVVALDSEAASASLLTGNIVTTFLQRVVEGSVLGLELGGSAWADWGWPFLIAITAVVTAYLVALLLRASSSRLVAAIAVATSVVMFLVSGYTRGLGDVMVWGTGVHHGLGARYAVVPTLLLIGAALVLVDSPRRSSRGRPVAAMATAAVLLVPLVTSFDATAGSGRGGPQWEESLDKATAECEVKGTHRSPGLRRAGRMDDDRLLQPLGVHGLTRARRNQSARMRPYMRRFGNFGRGAPAIEGWVPINANCLSPPNAALAKTERRARPAGARCVAAGAR